MNSKKISIITVCHNAENTISKTIDSVNSQTFQNIEHIIIDGLSTDLTYKIEKNKKKLPGIILSEKDESSQSAMNKALNYVTGDVVFFLHADDFLSNKNIINEVMNLFKDNIELDKELIDILKFDINEYKQTKLLQDKDDEYIFYHYIKNS